PDAHLTCTPFPPRRSSDLKPEDHRQSQLVIRDPKLIKSIPGDGLPLAAVHPAFDLHQARPPEFEPMVGGIDFFDDGRMVITTWDDRKSTRLNSSHVKISYA